MNKADREALEGQRHFSEEHPGTPDHELDHYMQIRKHRTRKRKRRQKLAGFWGVTAVLLIVMGVTFRISWMKAGEGEPSETKELSEAEETASLGGEVRMENGEAETRNGEADRQEEEQAFVAVSDTEDEILMPQAAAEPGSPTGKEETGNLSGSAANRLSDVTDQSSAEDRARLYAAQYNYDKALALLKDEKDFDKNETLQVLAEEIQAEKDSCTAWPLEEVTHVFYHTLVKDTALAFDGDERDAGYNQYMTTIDEFNRITQSMYDKGYVMVSIYDMAQLNEDGKMVPGEILLPPGKKPFVLSQDDVCYYHYMDGDGMAAKLVLDEDGKIRNTYIEQDGSISVGDYDMVPLIDRFVETHPDFSYRGAKGIVALTGYNGILGYRTDISYETRPEDMDDNKKQWLKNHPEFDLEKERAEAKKVAEAMKQEGWLFASHTWGHLNVGEVSLDRLIADTERFQENVDPLIGGTDIIIFAFGTDLTQYQEYSGEKYEYLYGRGYRYYCNVDSSKYFVQLTDSYLRMGRRNLDGYRMYYNPDMLADLFDVSEVFDPARTVPVPPM